MGNGGRIPDSPTKSELTALQATRCQADGNMSPGDENDDGSRSGNIACEPSVPGLPLEIRGGIS